MGTTQATIDLMGDRQAASAMQAAYHLLGVENAVWDSLVKLELDIEGDLKAGRVVKAQIGIQKHNLNVLHDYLLVLKVRIQAIRFYADTLAHELDRRGYPKDEVKAMKDGFYVW
jgi:hypothetical protein